MYTYTYKFTHAHIIIINYYYIIAIVIIMVIVTIIRYYYILYHCITYIYIHTSVVFPIRIVNN